MNGGPGVDRGEVSIDSYALPSKKNPKCKYYVLIFMDPREDRASVHG